jgi:hypothetical protein
MRTESGICNETRSLVYTFLDELRDSGETNMFGAGPYLRDEFGLNKHQSRIILSEWMQDFESGLLSQGEIS